MVHPAAHHHDHHAHAARHHPDEARLLRSSDVAPFPAPTPCRSRATWPFPCDLGPSRTGSATRVRGRSDKEAVAHVGDHRVHGHGVTAVAAGSKVTVALCATAFTSRSSTPGRRRSSAATTACSLARHIPDMSRTAVTAPSWGAHAPRGYYMTSSATSRSGRQPPPIIPLPRLIIPWPWCIIP